LSQVEKLLGGARGRRRGAVSMLLVFAFAAGALLLVTMSGVRALIDLVLLQQSQQLMEQVVPASYICLDRSMLAVGQPKLQIAQATSLLHKQFDDAMPGALKGRLQLETIEFYEQAVDPDPNHWMGSEQPAVLPVVVLKASFVDHLGRKIHLSHSIEMLLD
jgi:hypothetical protein